MIRLGSSDAQAVRELVDLPDALHRRLSDVGPSGIRLDDDEADELCDRLTEQLARIGFDAAYKPTPVAVALEDLIDRLTAQR